MQEGHCAWPFSFSASAGLRRHRFLSQLQEMGRGLGRAENCCQGTGLNTTTDRSLQAGCDSSEEGGGKVREADVLSVTLLRGQDSLERKQVVGVTGIEGLH